MVVAERREVLSPVPKSEVILTDCLIHDVMTQECESADFSNGHVGALGRVAVPDTACRRTLVGAYTLQLIESHLADQGLKTHRRREISEFRFGNSETLIGRECVILPACVGRHKFLIKTSILCGKGRNTSLVLSKEFLGELGSVLDMGDDTVSIRRFGVSMKSGVTERGHYAMSFFEFQNQECLIGEVQHMKHDRQYDIQDIMVVGSPDWITCTSLFMPCSVICRSPRMRDRLLWSLSWTYTLNCCIVKALWLVMWFWIHPT